MRRVIFKTTMLAGMVLAFVGSASAQAPPPVAVPPPVTAPKPAGAEDHSAHLGAAAPRADQPQGDQPKEPIPVLSDADRAAAFPDVHGHALHDRGGYFFVLADQFEWQVADRASGLSWDIKSWIGGDRDRVWLRSEGETDRARVDHTEAHVLYGRAVSRWWDLVGGVRQDVRPGPARTWAAIGVQGLAPQWFEVELTGYLDAGGRTHVRLETEYDLLLTNRLVLQPLVEVEIYGKADPERRIGAGVSAAEAGLRVRYEVRREFAPYLGLVWQRRFAGTADYARAAGEEVGGWRAAVGVRLWY